MRWAFKPLSRLCVRKCVRQESRRLGWQDDLSDDRIANLWIVAVPSGLPIINNSPVIPNHQDGTDEQLSPALF